MFRHHPWPFTWSQICIWTHLKLDESMVRRHLKSPQSLSGRFLPWSPNDHGHGHECPTPTHFVQCQSALPLWDTAISKFDHQNPWSRLWPRSNPLVTFMAWSSIDMFAFDSWQSDHFRLRYSKFHIWPWKFKVKVMAQVKPVGHIWGLKFYRYVCFHFVAIGPFWDSKFHIWPWKLKVKVMAKIKPNGHIWGLEFNRYVCFLFHGNRTIYGWYIAN